MSEEIPHAIRLPLSVIGEKACVKRRITLPCKCCETLRQTGPGRAIIIILSPSATNSGGRGRNRRGFGCKYENSHCALLHCKSVHQRALAMSSSTHGSSAKAIRYALIANGVIAIAKSIAAFFTGSGTMLAEAIHSFADCGNQVLLFIGLRQSAKAPDPEHPLGYGKASYFWSFVVAIMLFSLGGLFSVYEGFHKLSVGEPVKYAWVALLVLGGSVIAEFTALLGCLREIRLIRGERRFGEWLRHTRNAELVVVLGEDLAAIIGLVLAFVFVALSVVTGEPIYDAIGSISIGVVLIVLSVFVATRMKALIVGRSADPDIVAAIERTIDGDEAIEKLFNAITLQLGPTIMLAAKVKLHSGVSMEVAVRQINALEKQIKEQFAEVQWCFIEPDIKD